MQWTRAPETFSNEYFKLMLEDTWTVRKWAGPVQYENAKSGVRHVEQYRSLLSLSF
jgi:catalase (peroxidase I)